MIQTRALVDAMTSHAASLGLFDKVNSHEPKSGPGRGMTCSVWIDRMGPAIGSGSGLNSTSAKVLFNVRIYQSMLREPQDTIDPEILDACDQLFEAYTGDFTLGGLVRMVDVLGNSAGHPLEMQSGYINIDNRVYRVLTISVPLIVNDAWEQS